MDTQTIERPKPRIRHPYVVMKKIESCVRKHKSQIYDEHISRADFAKMATLELGIQVNPAHLKIATETLKIAWPRQRRNGDTTVDPLECLAGPKAICLEGFRALADSVAQLHNSLGVAIPLPLRDLQKNLNKY